MSRLSYYLERMSVSVAGFQKLAYGLRSIAVPVWSQSGEALAAINLAVHRSLVSMEDLVFRLSPALERTAGAISSRLGYRSAPAPSVR